MIQLDLFEKEVVLRAPNISRVPKYSPLRYPGGKTWLYPFAKSWLLKNRNKILYELFAGGASVGLMAGIENLVKHVFLIELDEDIYSIWKIILSDDAIWLSKQIVNLELEEDNINLILKNKDNNLKYKALATLILNRINHGGILANGSGRIKYGENGRGIKSRWYPKTLYNRIILIHSHREKFTALKEDALKVLSSNIENDKLIFFIDPPYLSAGKRLYKHSDINHEKLFELCSKIKGSFLMTYDMSDEIVDLANKFNFKTKKILMQTTHLIKKYELLISRNFSWL